MQHNAIVKYLVLVFLIFICCGCMGPKAKQLDIAFYHLDYPPPEILVDLPPAGTVAVEPFRVMPPFDTSRIIYATSRVVYDAYAYHQWFGDPSNMIFALLFRDMRSAGIFQAVMAGDDRLADYRVTGTVESFLERDHEDYWEAVLSVTVTLVDKTNPDTAKQVRFQKNYATVQPLVRKHPRALADAMSMAVARLSPQIIKDIHDDLSSFAAAKDF